MIPDIDGARFWGKVQMSSGCWIWEGAKDAHGYGLFSLGDKNARAHRIAYRLTKGAIPEGMVIRHTCDNTSCVRPEHLLLGTQLDNIADRNERGRTARGDRAGRRTRPERYPRPQGSKNGRAILAEQDVLAIRAAHADGVATGKALAVEYSVSYSLIKQIIRRVIWRHI
jgi:hypothetical protein